MSGTIGDPLAQILAAFGLPVQTIGNTDTLGALGGVPLASMTKALGGPVPPAPVIGADVAPIVDPAVPAATPVAPIPAPVAGNGTPLAEAVASVTPPASSSANTTFFPNIFGVDLPPGATFFGIPVGPRPGVR